MEGPCCRFRREARAREATSTLHGVADSLKVLDLNGRLEKQTSKVGVKMRLVTQSSSQQQRRHHGQHCDARSLAGVLFSATTTPEGLSLELHSAPPALRAARMDRPGHPRGDNDIVERYRNPSKVVELPRA